MALRYRLRNGVWASFIGGRRIRVGDVLEGAQWAAFVPSSLEAFEVQEEVISEAALALIQDVKVESVEAVVVPFPTAVVDAVVEEPVKPKAVTVEKRNKKNKR